jgi:hypothetical protein
MIAELDETINLSKKHSSMSVCKYVTIPPKWLTVVLLNVSKIYIESAITLFVVPKSINLLLSQIKYNNSAQCEDVQSSKLFQELQFGLALSVVIVNDLIILMRRIGPHYDLVMSPEKFKEKYKKACSDLQDLSHVQSRVLMSAVAVLFFINCSCLFVSSLQSQREFIKSHPDFLQVKVWGNNLGVQLLFSACLVVSSTVVNVFEAIYNAGKLFKQPCILLNKKLLIVLINSMVHALILRLFVLRFASENKMSTQSSLALQAVFVFGAVGCSILTTGVGLTMPKTKRFERSEGFYGESLLKVFMVIYGIMFTLSQQNIGVYHLMADFYRHNESSVLDYCDSGIQQPISLIFYIASTSLAGFASYTYINYINNQVRNGASKMVSAVRGYRQSGLWAGTRDTEKTDEMTPLMSPGDRQFGPIN